LRSKLFKFEARIARNSETIAKIRNEEVGHFGLNTFVHNLIRGFRAKSATFPAKYNGSEGKMFTEKTPDLQCKDACESVS